MTVSTVWLVRHGESVGNAAASRAEREGLEVIPLDLRDADVPLSDTGRDQAAALGGWLDAADIDRFWVSPYLRARQTLDLALAGREGPDAAAPTILVDERLRDRELGILDLLTTAGVARRHPEEAERRRRLGKFYHRPPGGESWADVSLRLRSFLGEALAGSGASIAVVAHDAIVTLVSSLLLGMGEEDLLRFAADNPVLNASVTRLDRDGDRWRLDVFSDVRHLHREGAEVTAHQGTPDDE